MNFGETAARRSFCSYSSMCNDIVPVTVPGGVYVLPPEVVRDVGNGSLKAGEKVLAAFVRKVRGEAQHTQKLLPPPRT